MDDEYAFAHLREALGASKSVFQKDVGRKEPKPFLGHGFHRGERRFEHERSGLAFLGDVRRGRPSEGPSPYDDLFRVGAFGYEIVERRFGITVYVAFLGDGTLAHSVSSVIDEEGVQPEFFERLHGIDVRGDVSPVSMKIQHRRFAAGIDEPSRKHDAVGSRKEDFGVAAS